VIVFPEEQSNIFKLFSDSSNNLLLYLDRDLKIKAINKAMKDKIDYFDDNDAIEKEYTDFFGIDGTSSVVIESLSSGQELNGLERLVNIRGKLLYLIIDTNIIQAENGEILGIVCIFHDITDRKIEEQKQLTIEKQASLGLLAAGIAHEIRNPLTAAMGFIQLLQQSSLDEKRQKKYLNLVLNELKSINKLVSNFMQLAKPTETNKQKILITELLNETIDFMQGQAILSNVVINRFTPFYGDIMVLVDSEQLKHVFINIIRNAIEASNKDHAVISISIEPLDKFVKIIIEDNGIGIATENLKKIYDPFYTTKKEGTGIGLTGVSQIIKNHNGSIIVDSKEGEGTKFTITLPTEQ
jgi:two-component system, sporulation sensor kinase E